MQRDLKETLHCSRRGATVTRRWARPPQVLNIPYLWTSLRLHFTNQCFLLTGEGISSRLKYHRQRTRDYIISLTWSHFFFACCTFHPVVFILETSKSRNQGVKTDYWLMRRKHVFIRNALKDTRRSLCCN